MISRIYYVVIYAVSLVCGFMKILAISSQLGPFNFGNYTLVTIAAALLSYINSMGILDAFLTRLNQTDGTAADRRRDRDSGMIFTLIASLITTGALVIVYVNAADHQLSAALLVVIFMLMVFQNLFAALMVEIQAIEQPILFASLLALKSSVPAVVVFTVRPGDDLAFVLILDLLVLLLSIGYLFWKMGIPSLANFEVSRVVRLIREGFAFTAQSASQNVSFNLDKWSINFGLGSSQLGVYAFATQLTTLGIAFATMIQTYALPRFVRIRNVGGTSSDVLLRVARIALASLVVSLIFFLFVVLMGRCYIPVYYPQYIDSIDLLPLLGVAAIIISCNHAEMFFRIRKVGRHYLAIQLGILALLSVAYACLIYSRAPLVAYAVTLVSARAVQMVVAFAVSIRIARRDTGGGCVP